MSGQIGFESSKSLLNSGTKWHLETYWLPCPTGWNNTDIVCSDHFTQTCILTSWVELGSLMITLQSRTVVLWLVSRQLQRHTESCWQVQDSLERRGDWPSAAGISSSCTMAYAATRITRALFMKKWRAAYTLSVLDSNLLLLARHVDRRVHISGYKHSETGYRTSQPMSAQKWEYG